MPELVGVAAQNNKTIDEVIAEVEIDGWMYSGVQPRNTTSYVCSAYVVAMYKAAGLLKDYDIQATEFTPRDLYNLNLFNTTAVRPEACVEADPDSPFCQLLGRYRMTFPGWSTVDIYPHMDETCPTIAPTYDRPEGC